MCVYHTHTYRYMYIYTYVYFYVRIYTRMYTFMYVCNFEKTRMCLHTYVCVYVCMYVCMYVYIQRDYVHVKFLTFEVAGPKTTRPDLAVPSKAYGENFIQNTTTSANGNIVSLVCHVII